jgi:hypothetical protein
MDTKSVETDGKWTERIRNGLRDGKWTEMDTKWIETDGIETDENAPKWMQNRLKRDVKRTTKWVDPSHPSQSTFYPIRSISHLSRSFVIHSGPFLIRPEWIEMNPNDWVLTVLKRI